MYHGPYDALEENLHPIWSPSHMSTQLPWEAPLFDHSGPDLDWAGLGFRAGGRFENPEGQLKTVAFIPGKKN